MQTNACAIESAGYIHCLLKECISWQTESITSNILLYTTVRHIVMHDGHYGI